MDLKTLGLSAQEKAKLKKAATFALARQDFATYCKLIDPNFEFPDHVKLLIEHLEKVERGEITRLIIVEPPRHGKSMITSGMFPLWYISKNHQRVVLLVSHSSDLAETFSVQNRNTLLHSENYRLIFPGITLNPARRSAGIWGINNQRENLKASGIQGGLTGYGASLIIFDDVIKTYEQAASPTFKDKAYNEYKQSARTRLTPNGAIIMIATRWVEDDLIGRVLDSPDGHNWTVLHLPAESLGRASDYERMYPDQAERDQVINNIVKHAPHAFPDPLDRPYGEALWPDWWPLEFLADQRQALGDAYNAMYQGMPGKPEGTKFKRKWFHSITPEVLEQLQPETVSSFRSYDLAWTEKQTSQDAPDYTVGLKATLYKVTPPDVDQVGDPQLLAFLKTHKKLPPLLLVLEDMSRWQLEWDEAEPRIINIAEDDGEDVQLLIEAVAAGNRGFKSLRSDLRMMAHRIIGINVNKDKEQRAKYPLALSSRGLVFLLHEKSYVQPEWVKTFTNELGKFPYGANDDCVDAFTQLVNYLQPTVTKLLHEHYNGRARERASNKVVRKSLPAEFGMKKRGRSRIDQMGWK